MSTATDNLMKCETLNDPRITVGQLKKTSKTGGRSGGMNHTASSEATFKPADKPLHTKLMVNNRLAFAYKYKVWTPE